MNADRVICELCACDSRQSGTILGPPLLCTDCQIAISKREVDELKAELRAYKAECSLLTHKVITCGVAATHPDVNLTRTGAYIGEWNSPQAERVRELRQRAEAAEQRARENEADAKRYRYLRNTDEVTIRLNNGGRLETGFCELDDAIDAALHSASASAAQTNNGSETA